MISRRNWLRASIAAGASALLARRADALAAPTPITVYKTPTCGCCKQWVKHLEANGFAVKVHDMDSLEEIKRSMGVPGELQSCHTGIVNKYVVEGHVPADLIQKMLKEKPAIVGLAVPGMPSGSPGMEQGGPKDRYDVIAFERGGKTHVYARRGV
jgi:hypothetical protein